MIFTTEIKEKNKESKRNVVRGIIEVEIMREILTNEEWISGLNITPIGTKNEKSIEIEIIIPERISFRLRVRLGFRAIK